jgi:hypothetical protein
MKPIMNRRLFFVGLLLMTFQAKAERADVVVRLPPELDMPAPKPLSPQEREQKEIRERINKKLPYNNDASGSLGTLGQLTKLCDWVFVGKVVDTKGNKVAAGAKEEFLGGVSVTLNWRGVTAPKGRLHLSPGQAQRSPGLWCIWPFGSVVRLNTCTVVVQKCCVPRVHFEFKAPLCVAPNRCGEDRDETQCLRGFAQNPHTQLLFLG